MVHIVNAGNASQYSKEMAQAYRLRHSVFVEERHWEALRKGDGREVDQFDTSHAIHIMEIGGGKVVGYSRLLPTVESHLLTDVYPHLAQKPIPQAADVFEWTRYCVAREARGERAVGNVGSRLFYSVLEYAWSEGLSALTMETDPLWITRFCDLGFNVKALGLPTEIDGEPVVALCVELSEATVHKARRMLRVKPLELQSRGVPAPAIRLPTAA